MFKVAFKIRAYFDNISQEKKKTDDFKILFMGHDEKTFNKNEIIPPKHKAVLESRRGCYFITGGNKMIHKTFIFLYNDGRIQRNAYYIFIFDAYLSMTFLCMQYRPSSNIQLWVFKSTTFFGHVSIYY